MAESSKTLRVRKKEEGAEKNKTTTNRKKVDYENPLIRGNREREKIEIESIKANFVLRQ